ncbi:MAG: helix-turn-helix domain-containing protein [Oligoflexia bacterium]|nr:helix-turn-helix domain-containing protein [Oligoflexia bacterium]
MFEINRKVQIRVDILAKYLEGLIDRKAASQSLELSERQFSRLVKSYRQHGVLSLFHGNKGKTPKNKTLEEIEERIKMLFRTKYVGFNIKHFWEKLKDELQHFRPSYTTVRRILIASGSLHLRKRAPNKNRRLRSRYESEGIMIQIDGSTHQWFGDQKSCLIAGIDDATGKILGAKFSISETTFATMDVLVDILKRKGRFHLLYSDKAGIYDNKKREGFSNVARALRELDIHSILAHSPQANDCASYCTSCVL